MSDGIKATVKRSRKSYAGMERAIHRGALDGVNAVALGMLNTAKQKILKGPASGRVYRKYDPKRTHQASAPGEAPASDTGRLVNSGTFETASTSVSVGAIITFEALYARFLEFGTRLIRPRPFIKPTAMEWEKKTPKIISAAIEDEIAKERGK